MKPRSALLVAAVLALGAANLWRWAAPGEANGEARAPQVAVVRAEELKLRAGPAGTERAPPGRNLFRPRLPPPAPPAPAPKVVEAAAPPPAAPPVPPPKTSAEIAEEAARDELRQIKLVGVVFRDGVGQAFLVKGPEIYMVGAGGRVGERFKVESIAAESIQLADPATRVHGQIPVSGR